MNEKRHPTGAWIVFLAMIGGIIAALLLHAKAGLILLLSIVAFLIYGTRIDKFYRERREGPSLPKELPDKESEMNSVNQNDINNPASYAFDHDIGGSAFSKAWENARALFKDE